MTDVIVIIPARYESKRLPGKVLMDLNGMSILQRVYQQVSKAKLVDRIIVATDHNEIEDHARSFGAEVERTFKSHKSGTDRCAQVSRSMWGGDIIINVQGDEPFINPVLIDQIAQRMLDDDWMSIASFKRLLITNDEIEDSGQVKVVTDRSGKALYFSRLPIPYKRDKESPNPNIYGHVGIYAFKNHILQEISALPESSLEQAEKLEQLRWLENAYDIQLLETEDASFSIDTIQDLERAKELC